MDTSYTSISGAWSDPNRCPFAVQVEDYVPDRPRTRDLHGLVVHTSGRGIVQQALKLGVDVLEHAVAYYQRAAYSAHYVGGYDGDLVQITADDRIVPHVGVSAEERRLYLNGLWRSRAISKLSATAIALWNATWGVKSPQHLYPGPSVNGVYVGLELTPLLEPTAEGLWYTDEQHGLVARLYADLHRRHEWTGTPSEEPPHDRLLGHEDVDAFGRWDRAGGWDPGALRKVPRFDWTKVKEVLRAL